MSLFVVRLFGCSIVRLFLLSLLAAPVAWAQTTQPTVNVKLGVDREGIYQFETFMVTIDVMSSGVRLGKGISLDGLPGGDTLVMGPIEDLPIERSLEGRTILETRHYRARCRALRPGTIRLAPSVAATQIVQQRTFFGRQWVENPIRLTVPAIEIPVAAIPAPGAELRPSGAVGSFTFDAIPRPLDVAAGDLIKMQVRISGDGYLDSVRCPSMREDAGFKVYPPRLIRKDDTGIEFEQVLIPLTTEAQEIPALTLTTFNARTGEYLTQTQGPYRVTFHAERGLDRSPQYRPKHQVPEAEHKDSDTSGLTLRAPEQTRPETVAAHKAASQAYASGYYEAALAAYENLNGDESAWLQYNRGVIYLGAGDYGRAIAQIMRSLHAEPRNPDARRALERACRAVGVALPDWAGRWQERVLNHPRWARSAVIIDPVSAHLAPARSARALFTCKPGEVVTIEEKNGTWISIRRGSDMGWIASEAVVRLASER